MLPLTPESPPRALPVGPTEDAWRAMSPEQQEDFLIEVLAALSDPKEAMSEGRPHKKAKVRSLDMLGLHFGALGRSVYLAEEMAVVYPGETVFSPDVLAVLDVVEPEDDQRLAWVVADEKKGLDFVLEVLDRGDRKKDLVLNVERYARLGIPEYFVYDRAQQRIRAYRLPVEEARSGAARRYQAIVPQGGRYASNVLGLDLAVEDGTLRFFHGMSELFGSDALIRRLTAMVTERDAKAEEAAARAEQATALAEQATARAEQATARAEQALLTLQTGTLTALETRGLALDEATRSRVLACDDLTLLQRWLLRALTAGSVEDVFTPDGADEPRAP